MKNGKENGSDPTILWESLTVAQQRALSAFRGQQPTGNARVAASTIGYAVDAGRREAQGRPPLKPQGAGRLGGKMAHLLKEKGLVVWSAVHNAYTGEVVGWGYLITEKGRQALLAGDEA